LADAPKPMHQP